MKVEILTSNLKVEAVDGDNWRLLEPLVFRVACDAVKSCSGTVCKDRWERKVYAR